MSLSIICMIFVVIATADRRVHSYPTDELMLRKSNIEVEPSKFAGRVLIKWSETEHYGNPEEQGPYFEGDIIVPNGRAFFTRQARKWDDGIIPYEISGSFSKFLTDISTDRSKSLFTINLQLKNTKL